MQTDLLNYAESLPEKKTGVLNYAEWDPEKKKVLFEIREDLSIDIPARGSLSIPIGYKTDFASIPWWFRWAIPSVGKHSIAALVHDYLYDEQIGTRIDADLIFLELMLHYNVSKVAAYTMYAGVRIGAGPWWERARQKKLLEK